MTGQLGRKVETQLTGRGQRHGLGDAGVHGARGERPEAGLLGTEEELRACEEPFYPRCFSRPTPVQRAVRRSECRSGCVWT